MFQIDSLKFELMADSQSDITTIEENLDKLRNSLKIMHNYELTLNYSL